MAGGNFTTWRKASLEVRFYLSTETGRWGCLLSSLMATFQRGGSQVILGYKTGSRALQKIYSPEAQGKCSKKSQERDVCGLCHLVSVTRAGVSGRSESSPAEGMSPYSPADRGGGVVRWARHWRVSSSTAL